MSRRRTAPAHAPLAALLVGGTAIVMLHDWLGLGGPRLDFATDGPLYDAVMIGAVLACLLRARAMPRERGAWLAIGLALLCWAAGDVYWTWFLLDDASVPLTSLADIGYLAFYPVASVGLVLLVRARGVELDRRLWADAVIAALGTAALGTAFVFEFVAGAVGGTGLEVAVSVAYPLADVAMLSLVVGVVALTDWRPGRTWSVLLVALSMLILADVAYTLETTVGSPPSGNWANPLYLLSAACLGAVLWQPTAAPLRAPASGSAWRELIVPAIVAVLMIGLFVLEYLDTTSALSTALRAITLVAIVARLTLSVRENKMLLQQVQTDVLTGLANRGRMQIDLERLCSHADEEHPLAVVFLDLDGFKHYNDTLGHPAGDALLSRLGRELRDAVAADGTAYRTGGDEFCVLLTCPERSFDSVARGAAKALSAAGTGFEVTASWGLAQVPAEASTPREALRLADVRMYAQKESHHLSRRGQEAMPPATSGQPTS